MSEPISTKPPAVPPDVTATIAPDISVPTPDVAGKATHTAGEATLSSDVLDRLEAMRDGAAMTAVCGVSGCGSSDAFLDTSTARTASWVQVRVDGLPQSAGAWRWFCSQPCAAAALGGTAAQERMVRAALVDELDAAAARLSTLYPGDLLMLMRAHGLQTARRIASPDRPGEGVAACWLCGCTEDDACAGGCWWVPDPDGIRDVRSNCADRAEIPGGQCGSPGCGTVEDLDGSDPALWGWARVQVAGTEGPARWVCSAACVGAVLSAAAAELAENDMTVASRGVARS